MLAALTQREILAFGLGCLLALAAFNSGVAQARNPMLSSQSEK